MRALEGLRRGLAGLAGLGLLAATASAGDLTADCDGWSDKASWPKKAEASVIITLYQKVDGQLVVIEVTSDSTLVPEGGGPFCLEGDWSMTLPDGTYCVEACETIVELVDGGQTFTSKTSFGPFECDTPDRGDSQLTPTGNECDDFVGGNAEDLVFTVNPAGNIAPGGFFFYTRIAATGDTNLVVTTSTEPDEAQDSHLRGAKVFILSNDSCQNISRRRGVSISTANNVVTAFVPASWVEQSEGGTIIVRAEYNTRPGTAGDVHNFETEANGSIVATESITVVAQ